MLDLTRRTRPAAAKDTLVVLTDKARLREVDIERADRQYLLEQLKEGNGPAICDISGRLVMVHQVEKGDRASQLEAARRAGAKMAARLNLARRKEAQLLGLCDDGEAVLALAEGVALANYQFRKYRSDDKQAHTLSKLNVVAPAVKPAELEELSDLVEATGIARDLVNEPLSFLTATQLSSELKNMARNSGFKLTVFDKPQIEALAMGGLLGVNRGSPDPPTFNILEWKPKNAVNKAPIVLVGKGVVYDTGGLSLKPTPHSMDYMKCDMAGAAAVAGALYAVAKRKLPLHVVGLIPATDNRPGGRAYVPGDVLRMHNGLTVEVMNTDAEGRLIMADALSFGERYKPELVLDAATLTGAAARAIGTQGVVAMGTAPEKEFKALEKAGMAVHERVARFPFWDEYDKELDSDIADLKNLGGDLAGAITAGKFLARFTTRPYIHLDIAGPAFLHKPEPWKPRGGTGVGVRLFYRFLAQRASK